MQFALLVKSHANVRYAQSMQKLATLECECMLYALQANANVRVESLANIPFLILETDGMDERSWSYLSRHSAVAMAALRDGEWLKPLALQSDWYLEPELAQVLKYKGKTNADFTMMMLNCARSASAFALDPSPLTVLDPLCGRGTSLFCALQCGDHAIGVETDESAVHDADVYLEHFLQFHRYKHRHEEQSRTLRAGGAVREKRFTLAQNAEAYKQGDTRTVRILRGNTVQTDEMLGRACCHLIVADLPYGVQHAPKDAKELGTFHGLLDGALPAYYRALKPGGAIAIAFNTYTLPRADVIGALRKAGFVPLEQPPFDDFSHWVEQAVNRDMVVAQKTSEHG